jgi:hypothetical protein
MSEVREFKSKTEPKPFTVNGQGFTAMRAIPGFMFLEFTKAQANKADDYVMGALLFDMFKAVMGGEEFERFRTFANSEDGPDLDNLIEIVQFLTGRDADRPTEPPSPSQPTASPPEAT